MSKFHTLPSLAKGFCVPLYAVEQAGIEPADRLGNIRLYSDEQIPMIRRALERTSVRPVAGPLSK